MKAVNVIRYSTILDFLENGPLNVDSIVENFDGKFPKNQILSTLQRMEEKDYIKIKKNLVTKKKDAFYHEQ